MKKALKMVSVFISIIMCLSLSVPVFAATEDAVYNQLDASYIENLQNFYASAIFKESFTTLLVSRTTQHVEMNYPSNYGGIYIDSNDDLHIQYVNEVGILDDSMQNYDVIYDSVQYGYNYLSEIYNKLVPKMTDFDISVLYIDEFDNKLSVAGNGAYWEEIAMYLAEQVASFDENCLSFTNPVQLEQTDAGGTSIKSNAGGFTLGYNAKKTSNGKYGFVTCGHAVSVGDTVKRNKLFGATLGTVKNSQLGGKIDASYVEYSNQDNRTTACLTGNYISGTYSSSQITAGMIVQKYGAKTKEQSGRVTAASVSVKVGTTTFTDQVQLDIRQEGGDSGAPVVHSFIGPLQNGQQRHNTLLGIATIADSSTWETAFASKACNINSALGLTTYILVL